MTRPDATILSVLPSAVAAIVGGLALPALVDRLEVARPPGPGPRPADAAPHGRRGRGLRVPVALAAGRLLGSGTRDAEASRAGVRLPAPADPEPALPAGVEVGVAGVTPFRVPAGDFYRIDTALVVPRSAPTDWQLRIHGTGRPRGRARLRDLLARPLVERDVTLACVSNEVGGDLVGNATWLGLPIGAPAAAGRARAEADMVLSTSVDGFTAGTPLAALTDGRDALLAVGDERRAAAARARVPGPDGRARPLRLRLGHEVGGGPGGHPVRPRRRLLDAAGLVAAGADQDRVADRRASRRRPAARGPGRRRGRRVGPAPRDRGRRGPRRRRGLAAGPARRAGDASTPGGNGCYAWDAAPGRHTLQVRATDRTGTAQTGVETPPAPDGATGWHTITVDVS